MTHDEANLLIERAAGDHAFRQKLLMAPQHAAAELDIAFSDDEVNAILSSAEITRSRCLGVDRLRDQDRRIMLLFKVAGATKQAFIQ